MVVAVIVTNVVIALGCLYAAWQVWQIRRALSKTADAVLSYERACHSGLSGSPEALYKAQRGVGELRQQYQKLGPQIQRVRQVLALVGLGRAAWQRRATVFRPKGAKRTRNKGAS